MTGRQKELVALAEELLKAFEAGKFPSHEVFEDGAIRLATLALDEVMQIQDHTPAKPEIRCRDCNGTDVKVVAWTYPNTGEIDEDFGSWNQEDTKFCNDCNDHVLLKLPPPGMQCPKCEDGRLQFVEDVLSFRHVHGYDQNGDLVIDDAQCDSSDGAGGRLTCTKCSHKATLPEHIDFRSSLDPE